ncbi:deoxynucleotidyltransferase terminal-interacting protein 2 [Phyllopteryx taeniolatus]|uniref:deoxynucleotidyltransferase terminal-interacting protein 2 n=1 Tax=Phyllopteryx taeniolatus TaxID=161469 RepID=UPI002AD2334C|nr:deoxynucleotidyltransferase terminal-interacting protein 2 [Phyllopteryx taeniolatus]
MVATRSRLRVCSPTQTNIEQPSHVQATPSNGRRTRNAARQADISTRRALVETSGRLREQTSDPQASVLKKCTRTSRLHSPEQPCTPVGSTHEADVSNLESGCSVTADVELPVTRSRAAHKVYQEEEVSEVESCSSKNGRSTRRRAPDKKGESGSSVVSDSEPPAMSSRRSRRLAVTLNFAEEVVSEADSCSSLVSAQKTVKRTRSSAVPDVDPVKAADDKVTCDLVPTESQSVTRSQRKSTRIYANPQPDESDVSDAESFTLDVSGAAASQSSSRRSVRSRKLCPIPFDLDEASESSPTQSSRRTTTTDEKSCDSEGFESGTEYTICTRQMMKTRSSSSKYAESDSDLLDGHCALGSPGRSRSGSGRQRRPAPNSTLLMKDLCVVLENATEGNLLDDSVLDSTVVAEEADCTLLEEEKKTTLMSNEAVVKEQGELNGEEVSGKVAVASADQQGELSAVKQEEDASAVEKIEDTGPSTSRITCEYVRTDDETNENVHMEVSLEDQGLHGDVSGTQEEVKDMEVQQVTPEDVKAAQETMMESSKEEEGEDIDERKPGEATASVDEQVTPEKSLPEDTKTTRDMPTVSHMEISEEVEKKEDESEEEDIGERPGPSKKPEEKVASSVNEQMTLKKSSSKEIKATPKTKTIRLMESSEDEEEEEDVSDQEDDDMGERRGSSMKHEKEVVAAESIDGLFMVDTRPGQELDEDYYTERLTQEEVVGAKKVEEEEEEFVDEEAGADDDDDCGEAALLLSSRNPLLKEMSSRIDPGINMRQLGGLYITFDGSKSKPGSSSVHRPKEKMDQDEVMKKSVLGPDFEKKDTVPPYSESKHALKQKRRVEREKTTGDAWFNMKAPELSNELKGDLKLLKMRASMDPKRFYKKNDRDGFAKYFQMATVVDNPVDFYHSRIPKKQRKRTMVEELLADAEFRSNNKKKFQKIVAEKAAQASGKHKKYKKNKFHKKSEKVTKRDCM